MENNDIKSESKYINKIEELVKIKLNIERLEAERNELILKHKKEQEDLIKNFLSDLKY